MQHLKANTEVKVVIGPFVDKTDGLTPETGVALNTADEAELMKHNAASNGVTDISAATWAAITGMDGYYVLTLTAALTDTEGMMTIAVNDDSVCLPVKAQFMVLAQAAWDSLYAAKDTGYLDVNIKAISEDTTAPDILELFVEALKSDTGQLDDGSFAANAITNAAVADDVDVNVKTVTAGIIANASFNADVGSTAYGTNVIALAAKRAIDEYDPPTNAEMVLRTLLAADYTVVGDLGTVQTGDSYAIVNGDHGLVSIQDDIDLVVKFIKNRRIVSKTGLVWSLIIYDDDNVTEIIKKELKDNAGNNITDLAAGAIARELLNSI